MVLVYTTSRDTIPLTRFAMEMIYCYGDGGNYNWSGYSLELGRKHFFDLSRKRKLLQKVY
jgi:hypothetical protein